MKGGDAMELKDRIAVVRKAAGLTQEQLGELLGVTRQAVSKWESGQSVPDALTVAKLCEELHVSADYVLLGREPEETAPLVCTMPEFCPCCGREVKGTVCTVCGYHMPTHPTRGPQYAIVATVPGFVPEEEHTAQLVTYCGLTEEEAGALIDRYVNLQSFVLLRRGLDDRAAQWIAAQLDRRFFAPCIVEDCGEEDEVLLTKPQAMAAPEPAKQGEGIGFWGVVGAVIVALLIMSFL